MDFLIESQIKVYPTVGDFPATGAVKTLYIDESTSTTYYWTGSAYSEIRTEAKYEAIDVLNGTGSSQSKMTICYLKTSSSSANTPEILLANANSEATSSKTIGLLLATLANGATGKLITSGEFDKFDTSAYNVGDRLWLATTDGQMTTAVPSAPNHAVFIGIVTRKQSNNGRILVAIQNGYELQELHNVSINSPITNQGIFYNSATGLWENKTISSAIGYTPVPNNRTISTIAPLTGGGDMTADRMLSIQQSTGAVDGYLSATDWTKFSNKVSSFKNANNGATVANTTTITPTYTQLIPANTYGAGDVIEVMTRVFSTITKASPSSMYIYINATPDLLGTPIQVGIVTAAQRTLQMERTLAIKGSTTRVTSSGVSAGQDFALSGTTTLLTIDWTINQYFVFAVGHSVALATETYTGDFYRILKN